MKKSLLATLAAIVLLLSLGIPAVMAFANYVIVSVSSGGAAGNNTSQYSDVSADGRYVVFDSHATNLVTTTVPGGSVDQIYWHDRLTGETKLVSISPDGLAAGDASSFNPRVSGDGQFVVLSSYATNLVSPSYEEVSEQVYMRDMLAGTTVMVSTDAVGVAANQSCVDPDISADGHYVVFASAATNLGAVFTAWQEQVFRRDMQAAGCTLVSENSTDYAADKSCYTPAISSDGRYVVFETYASNLDGTTGNHDQIFRRDMNGTGADKVKGVSKTAAGVFADDDCETPHISGDGQYVVFTSDSENLVAFPTPEYPQIYYRDMQAAGCSMVSVNLAGVCPNHDSEEPDISGDGRYVVFESDAWDLVDPSPDPNEETQIYMRDMQAATTVGVSKSIAGVYADYGCGYPCINSDGTFVAFSSGATNLGPVNPSPVMDQIFLAGAAPIPPVPTQPTVTAVAPATGLQGQCPVTVVITGTNLTGATAVSFGTGITVSGKTVNSDTQITATICISTDAPVGPHDVSVTTPAGTATLTGDGFTVGSLALWLGTGGQTSHGGGGATGAGSTGQANQGMSPVSMPNIVVQSATISSTKVAPGETITITANLANKGTVNGTSAVKVYVNGQEEAAQGITINSGSNRPVSFTISRNEPGTYTVYVGGTPAGSFTVEQAVDPNVLLFISAALVLAGLALGVVYIRRRQSYQ